MGDREIRSAVSLFDVKGNRIEFSSISQMQSEMIKDFVHTILTLRLPVLLCTQSYVGVLDVELERFELRIVNMGGGCLKLFSDYNIIFQKRWSIRDLVDSDIDYELRRTVLDAKKSDSKHISV